MGKNFDDLSLQEFLKKLLLSETVSTQEDVCRLLILAGFNVNQSKVSRLLRKIGAIKTVDLDGLSKYTLPKELPLPYKKTPLKDLVVKIQSNESLIVVITSPGSASLIARVLDNAFSKKILGTVAGDDTIFIAPISVAVIPSLESDIVDILKY